METYPDDEGVEPLTEDALFDDPDAEDLDLDDDGVVDELEEDPYERD